MYAEVWDKVLPFLSRDFYYFAFIGFVFLAVKAAFVKKWAFSIAMLACALGWQAMSDAGLIGWVQSLGEDSIAELDGFSYREALFWLTTIAHAFQPELDYRKLAVVSFLSLLSLAAIAPILIAIRSQNMKPLISLGYVGIALVGFGFFSVFANLVRSFTTPSFEERIARNFSAENLNFEPGFMPRRDLNVVLMIGESTASMNMSLYGYPRDTTPLLSDRYEKDEGMLVFEHVFSTHTHTTPSLLEALSLGLVKEQEIMPIEERRRIPLPDILAHAEVGTTLISNQGRSGSWNTGSSIIFRSVQDKHYSTNVPAIGSYDYLLERPFDHELFNQRVNESIRATDSPHVLFLHAYAGHGPYTDFIPEVFIGPVDRIWQQLDSQAIAGDRAIVMQDFESYDSSIRYVDYSVNNIIEEVANIPESTILIFTSDHGESPYTGSGHESSRFAHEMLRVPFIMYFNSSARNEYPELFEKYRKLLEEGRVSTLARLSATVLDLLGIQLSEKRDEGGPIFTPVIGEFGEPKPVLVRRIGNKTEYISLGRWESEVPAESSEYDVNDEAATKIYRANRLQQGDTLVCYHRSNSVAAFLRGKLVAGCVEVDLVVGEDGSLHIYHPPATDVSFDLDFAIDHLLGNTHGIWIDAKNLTDMKNCEAIADSLGRHTPYKITPLVELPSKVSGDTDFMASCGELLRKLGTNVSYYVPTGLAKECQRELVESPNPQQSSACNSLHKQLKAVLRSGGFSDISFDWSVMRAVESLPETKELTWNTWNVSAEDFTAERFANFGRVILRNQDPNHR
jgi:glucan phosphoethanolaminetransferase (alkaline phosphatase superfamily)